MASLPRSDTGPFLFLYSDTTSPLPSYRLIQASFEPNLYPCKYLSISKAAILIHWIVPTWHFSATLTEVSSVLFPSIVRRTTRKNGARHALFARKVDKFHRDLPIVNSTHDHFGFRSSESLPAKVTPPPSNEAYCLLSNGPQFAHVGVFNLDGKLVRVSTIPVIV